MFNHGGLAHENTFGDNAGRFGQQGSLTRLWAERGLQPRCWRQTEYKWACLFGAACPSRGEAVGYLMPTANTFCMNLHLAEISQSVEPDVQVALVPDGGGRHSSQALRVPDSITLIPLPPCSPELNPMELVRLYLKSHYLANRVYADHDALYEAGIDAWNRFTKDPKRVGSVCHAAWTESAWLN